MTPWTEKLPKFEMDSDTPLQSVLVHTVRTTNCNCTFDENFNLFQSESIRVRFFLDILMDVKYPVMLVGNAGCGKTVLVNDKLSSLSENYAITNVPFNFYTR